MSRLTQWLRRRNVTQDSSDAPAPFMDEEMLGRLGDALVDANRRIGVSYDEMVAGHRQFERDWPAAYGGGEGES